MDLPYKKLTPDVDDLFRATPGSAGIDLRNGGPAVTIGPWCSVVIPCGVAIQIPPGHWGHVSIRSGLGFNKSLASHIGVIDADFRGEVKAKVFNHTNLLELAEIGETIVFRGDLWKEKSVTIAHGERFAQLVIVPYLAADPVEVEDVSATLRGERGYGSSGR